MPMWWVPTQSTAMTATTPYEVVRAPTPSTPGMAMTISRSEARGRLVRLPSGRRSMAIEEEMTKLMRGIEA